MKCIYQTLDYETEDLNLIEPEIKRIEEIGWKLESRSDVIRKDPDSPFSICLTFSNI